VHSDSRSPHLCACVLCVRVFFLAVVIAHTYRVAPVAHAGLHVDVIIVEPQVACALSRCRLMSRVSLVSSTIPMTPCHERLVRARACVCTR
jgi:hypothetical protein